MIKKIFEFLAIALINSVFWLRYKVEVRGLENLDRSHLKKAGGVLLLPNHPAVLADPALVSAKAWKKIPIRPIIVEYMYFLPFVHTFMTFIRALPMPDFESSSNSLKKKKGEKAVRELIDGLQKGENFLIYPAGRLKRSAIEEIGGASMTHQIISQAPDANIILVRTKGLWGSMFSSAYEGRTPPLFPTLIKGIKVVFKNVIFFCPRRKIIIEYHPAPKDFPYQASRLELNRWLEKWYNQPDGLTEQQGAYPGDSLIRVSYSFWKQDDLELYKPKETVPELIAIEDIDASIQARVFAKLQELSEVDAVKIKPEMTLSSDLGLDSLDLSELAAFLHEHFQTQAISVTELTTVNRVLGFASKKIKINPVRIQEKKDLSAWRVKGPRVKLQMASGETIPEVFLNNCDRIGNAPACSDERSGIVSYPKFKTGVLLFADYIRRFPEKHIGILLPASVAAYLVVLACQLVGKVPVMINWTIGPRHLTAVRELSKLKVVLTSWAFLEKLDADLTGVDDILIMLEDIKRELSFFGKVKSFIRSKRKAKAILKIFGADKIKKEDNAVLLFTSGTENMPKGVPLTHENILWNARGVFDAVDIYSDDIMLGILPPFHAFGFGTSGLMELFSGVRAAYYPNPTDGQGVAEAFERWQATITCGAPSFLKALLKAATPEQLRTMRICVSGAEKAPPELFKLLASVGKESCLIEGYGVTECSPILTATRLGKPRKGVGSPLIGVELCIVHPETHEVLPTDTEGLILARGLNVFKGYLNPDVKSPFLSVEGKSWYNTGDIGFLDEENRLSISGRQKRFVKAGGEMISLQAIENTLLQASPGRGWKMQEDGIALAIIAKEIPGEKPVIILVATFDTTMEEVNQVLYDSGFSNLIRISRVVKMPEIPLMGTGKINYRLLEEKNLT